MAQQGDRHALDQLLRRHQPRIHALCRRLAGNDADGLDATQEALITIARRIDRFDGRSQFGTWAYRVATNACLDELRRRKRRPEPVDLDALTGSAGQPTSGAVGVDHAAAIVDRFSIDAALAMLPEEFRVAVVLRDLLTLDYAEIAETVGVPIGTVRSRIARGRALLARHLEASGNQDDPAHRPSQRSHQPKT
ncbi:MAG: sigma-70 family RNA polymerase sigma factor [Acidimicrobiia bacterium]